MAENSDKTVNIDWEHQIEVVSQPCSRRGSTASDQEPGKTTSSLPYRRRKQPVEETEDELDGAVHRVMKWRGELEALLFDDSSKIAKWAANSILGIFGKVEKQLEKFKAKSAYLKGRLDEREKLQNIISHEVETVVKTVQPQQAATKPVSYAAKLKAAAPKVGKNPIRQKSETTVLIYPKDKRLTDSEETKKQVKTLLAPKEGGFQVKGLRKVPRGGIAIEAGSVKSAQAIRDATNKLEKFKTVDIKKSQPRVMIYDVDKTTSDEDFLKSLYKQNLEDDGITLEEVIKDVHVRFKTGNREKEVNNWVLECPARIRELLISKKRAYIDFSSCRVVDYLAIPRCYKCQGYGHVVKHCKKTDDTCSQCGKDGHNYKACTSKAKPVCINCQRAKKPCEHKVGTKECPMYQKMVERILSNVQYNAETDARDNNQR